MLGRADYGINLSEFIGSDREGGGGYSPPGSKVLLHESENCMECSKSFLSLYPLKCCRDHDGLDSI